MAETMRAVVADKTGGPEVLKLQTVPVPEPGKGEVRIKVAYCSMNPMDVFAREGKIPWMRVPMPFIPGIEHAGVIDKVGEGVDKSWIGKRAHSRNWWGGNAEYSVAPTTHIMPMADGLDWKTGSVYMGMTYTSYHTLHSACRVREDDWCLFHSAAGPIGIMLTQIARDAGAKVIGLCSPAKFDYARSFGAQHLIDAHAGDWEKQVMTLTGDVGVDIIVDGNQGPQAAKNLEVIAPGGHVVYIGATAGSPAPDIAVRSLIYKSAFVGGFNLPLLEKRRADARDVKQVLENIKSGKWRVPISEEVTLDGVPDLHQRFAKRLVKGRAIIKVGGELPYGK